MVKKQLLLYNNKCVVCKGIWVEMNKFNSNFETEVTEEMWMQK